MEKINVSEIFESLQGEGRYVGVPMLFIRLFGCTRDCPFCDTDYSKKGKFKKYTIEELVRRIKKSKMKYVCWTGGEPLLQVEKIIEIIKITKRSKYHHLETNGDLIDKIRDRWMLFDYIAISPKEEKVAEKVAKEWNLGTQSDIKIVTDLKKVGREMLRFATMLMPLTTGNKRKDNLIRKKVWEYCVKHRVKYSPRIQVETWGAKKRKV